MALNLISKKLDVYSGFIMHAVSAPLAVPPIAITSSSIGISPASADITVISIATFTPAPKIPAVKKAKVSTDNRVFSLYLMALATPAKA